MRKSFHSTYKKSDSNQMRAVINQDDFKSSQALAELDDKCGRYRSLKKKANSLSPCVLRNVKMRTKEQIILDNMKQRYEQKKKFESKDFKSIKFVHDSGESLPRWVDKKSNKMPSFLMHGSPARLNGIDLMYPKKPTNNPKAPKNVRLSNNVYMNKRDFKYNICKEAIG